MWDYLVKYLINYSPRIYSRRIMQILYGPKELTAFTSSTITLPKVNRFWWNLEQCGCEPNVGGWPRQILDAIRSVATVWEGAEFFYPVNSALLHRFYVKKNQYIWAQQRQSVSPCKLSEQNFTTRGRLVFQKKQKLLTKFPIIANSYCHTAPQWLPIAGNSLSNGSSTGCLVSIFTVRINSKSFPWAVRCAQVKNSATFSARSVRYVPFYMA